MNCIFFFERKRTILKWSRIEWEEIKKKELMIFLLNILYWKSNQINKDNPLNLNILLSGGKESNNDSCSNGEWRRNKCKIEISAPGLNCSFQVFWLNDDVEIVFCWQIVFSFEDDAQWLEDHIREGDESRGTAENGGGGGSTREIQRVGLFGSIV